VTHVPTKAGTAAGRRSSSPRPTASTSNRSPTEVDQAYRPIIPRLAEPVDLQPFDFRDRFAQEGSGSRGETL